MAVKTLYFKNVTVNGALSLQDGGAAPTGALTTTGWTVAKLAAPNFSLMAVGAEKTAFVTVDALTTPTFTAASCWRSESPFNGTFANTNWSLAFRARAVTQAANATGAVKVRIWKSLNADGSGAVQLTSAILAGTTTAGLTTAASATSTVTWSPGAAVVFNNEYLFVQCEWSIVATSSGTTADVLFYVESAGAITTPDFAPTQALTPGLVVGDDAFLAPRASASTIQQPALVFDSDAINPSGVSAFAFLLEAVSYSSDDAIYAPARTSKNDLLSAAAIDLDAIYMPAILTLSTASPVLVIDVDVTTAATMAPGAAPVLPDLYIDVEATFAATTATVVLPLLLEAVDTVFSPWGWLPEQYPVPPLHDDGDAIFVSAIVTTGQIAPALHDDGDAIFVADVQAGEVALAPQLENDPDTVYAAATKASVMLLPSLVVDGDNIAVIMIVPGTTTLQAALHVDTDAFPATTCVAGAIAIFPAWAVEADLFLSPMVQPVVPAQLRLRPARIIDLDTIRAAQSKGGSTPQRALTGSIGKAQLGGNVASPALTGSLGKKAA